MISTFSPEWFFGYDVVFELAFAIIALIVSILAFRVYKKTSQNNIMYFGVSFLLFSISYLIQSILNFLIISEINEQVHEALELDSIALFNFSGAIVHVIFMISGLAILVFTIFRTKNKVPLILLILISIFGILFSNNPFVTFYLFSTIYLIFLSVHFIVNYFRNKQTKTLLIAGAFILLLFSSFHFLISVDHQLFYVIGHFLELFAYLLILANLYLVLK